MKELTKDELRNWDKYKNGIPQGYDPCPHCLNGWRRDVGPDGNDEECYTCDYTGYLRKSENWLKREKHTALGAPNVGDYFDV